MTGATTPTLALLAGRNLLEVAPDAELTVHQVVHDVMALETPAAVRERHAQYYLDQVEVDPEDWRQIELWYPQLKQARLGLAADDTDRALAFVGRLGTYQGRRGLWQDKLAWAQQALTLAEQAQRTSDQAVHAGASWLVGVRTPLVSARMGWPTWRATCGSGRRIGMARFLHRLAGGKSVGAGHRRVRVVRGGAFHYGLWDVRCAARGRNFPNNDLGDGGFRVVLPPASG